MVTSEETNSTKLPNERRLDDEIKVLFSDSAKFRVYRQLIVELVEARNKFGISKVPAQTILQMQHAATIFEEEDLNTQKNLTPIERNAYAFARQFPFEDEMIKIFAKSHFVLNNAKVIITRDVLNKTHDALVEIIKLLAVFANQYKKTPTFSYNYPTTVGERATMWLQRFIEDLNQLDSISSKIKLCGLNKSLDQDFKKFFPVSFEKIDEVNHLIANNLGLGSFSLVFDDDLTTLNANVLSVLSSISVDISLMNRDMNVLNFKQYFYTLHSIQNSARNATSCFSNYMSSAVLGNVNGAEKYVSASFVSTYSALKGSSRILDILSENRGILLSLLNEELKAHNSPTKLIKLSSARVSAYLEEYVKPFLSTN